MADSGAGIINLKRAGVWKSSTVGQGYITESAQMKSIQVAALKGKPDAKKKKTGEPDVVVAAAKGDDDEPPPLFLFWHLSHWFLLLATTMGTSRVPMARGRESDYVTV
eukprot:12379082-Ditylum_brightwellii.AAC.2